MVAKRERRRREGEGGSTLCQSLAGTTVTVTGPVNEVADQNAFEIAAQDGRGRFPGASILPRSPPTSISRSTPTSTSPADRQHVIVADRVQLVDPSDQ